MSSNNVDCSQCENRWKVDGFSQKAICSSCIHEDNIKKDYFLPKTETSAIEWLATASEEEFIDALENLPKTPVIPTPVTYTAHHPFCNYQRTPIEECGQCKRLYEKHPFPPVNSPLPPAP